MRDTLPYFYQKPEHEYQAGEKRALLAIEAERRVLKQLYHSRKRILSEAQKKGVVDYQKALILKKAGFPQPNPKAGAYWWVSPTALEQFKKSEGLLVIRAEVRTQHQSIMSATRGYTPQGAHNAYFAGHASVHYHATNGGPDFKWYPSEEICYAPTFEEYQRFMNEQYQDANA